ncbi:MAG: hypothetical protein CVU50_06220 [Candidatus Cloacimonetes bacterium HGW-Cloacimonetes-3]|jgi:hypothetical protein|nr:MAG: hypothetical protein CVU50_06220 [Candidatus Cloacimonetes bacterium HGW-Cloacimonetes-3]
MNYGCDAQFMRNYFAVDARKMAILSQKLKCVPHTTIEGEIAEAFALHKQDQGKHGDLSLQRR